MIHNGGNGKRLYMLPVGVLGFGDRDEVAAEKHPRDALYLIKQCLRHWGRSAGLFAGIIKRASVSGNFAAGHKFDRIRVRGRLCLDEHSRAVLWFRPSNGHKTRSDQGDGGAEAASSADRGGCCLTTGLLNPALRIRVAVAASSIKNAMLVRWLPRNAPSPLWFATNNGS